MSHAEHGESGSDSNEDIFSNTVTYCQTHRFRRKRVELVPFLIPLFDIIGILVENGSKNEGCLESIRLHFTLQKGPSGSQIFEGSIFTRSRGLNVAGCNFSRSWSSIFRCSLPSRSTTTSRTSPGPRLASSLLP